MRYYRQHSSKISITGMKNHTLQLAKIVPSVLKSSFSQNFTFFSSQNREILLHCYFHPSSFKARIITLPKPFPRIDLLVTIFSIFPTRPLSTVLVMMILPKATTFSAFRSIPTMLMCLLEACLTLLKYSMKLCLSGRGALVSWLKTSKTPL